MFIKHFPKGIITLQLEYVDYMIVAGDDPHEKQVLKEKLVAQFEMKDQKIKVLP